MSPRSMMRRASSRWPVKNWRAAAVVGQRGDRAHDRELAAAVGAVVGLEPPDGDDDLGRHAEALLDAIERGPVRAHQGLAPADQRAAHAAGVELLEGELEGALRAVEPDQRSGHRSRRRARTRWRSPRCPRAAACALKRASQPLNPAASLPQSAANAADGTAARIRAIARNGKRLRQARKGCGIVLQLSLAYRGEPRQVAADESTGTVYGR